VPGLASKPVCRMAVLALLVPSPTSSRASTRATRRWVPASSRLIAEPTIPAPMTATSALWTSLTGWPPRARGVDGRAPPLEVGLRTVGRPHRLEDLVGLPRGEGPLPGTTRLESPAGAGSR